MKPGRLMIDGPARGSWNMAFDQALLEEVSRGGAPVLRFYQWESPTLSLGYFQHVSERQTHAESMALPLVRRATGGGALVHDRELTYSLVLPISDRTSQSVAAYYKLAHQVIIDVLTKLGISAQRFEETPASHSWHQDREPFLCFQRRTPDDLVIHGYKVVGSAQRRAARAVLQHGGILLAASPQAPQLPGIEELTSRPIDAAELTQLLASQFANALELNLEITGVAPSVTDAAHCIEEEKYDNAAWNQRRR